MPGFLHRLARPILVLFFSAAGFAASAPTGLVFDNGFEGGAADWGASGPWSPSPSDATSSNVSREGAKSVRFVRLSTDVKPDMTKNERSEFVYRNGPEYEWGREYWEGFSLRVIAPTGGNSIVFQHHATPHTNPGESKPDWSVGAGGNSFTIRTNGATGKFDIYTQTDPSKVDVTPGRGGATAGALMVSAPYVLDRWYDFVLHFRLAPDDTGIMEVWMTDTVSRVKTKLVGVTAGPTVYRKDFGGLPKTPRSNQKIGIYYGRGKTPTDTTRYDRAGEMLYDAIRVWAGSGDHYADVAPRGSSISTQ